MTITLPLTKLREEAALAVVRFQGRRAIVTKNGKAVCAVVSLQDLQELERRAVETPASTKGAT